MNQNSSAGSPRRQHKSTGATTDSPRGRHRGPHAKSVAVAIVSVTTMLTLVSCSGRSLDPSVKSGAAIDSSRTTLRIAWPQEPPSWDFLTNPANAIRGIISLNVVEPLLEQDRTGKINPLLASSYTVSPDRRQYVFTIRSAKFHDGSALTAADVVYSLQQSRKSSLPKTAVPLSQVETVTAKGEHQVKVTLKRPSNAFLLALAGDSGLIIKAGSASGLATHPLGTGPFKWGSWRHGVDVTLGRFDGYWGKQAHLANIDVRFITDENSTMNQLRAGQIDFTSATNWDQVKAFKSQGTAKVIALSGFGTNYLALNAKLPAFHDSRVRQAIAMAIDRKAITEGVFAGSQSTTCVWVWPGRPAPTKDCPYPYNPAEAKRLLATAGTTGLKVELKYHVGGRWYAPQADLVAADLKKIGITVTRSVRDTPSFFKEVLQTTPAQYQMAFLASGEPLSNWRCPNGWFLNRCDKQFDEMLDKADAAPSLSEYASLTAQANLRLAKEAYLIPLNEVSPAYVMNHSLDGIQGWPNQLSSIDMRGIYWTK